MSDSGLKLLFSTLSKELSTMIIGGRPSVFDLGPWEPSGRPQLADQMVDHQPETYQTLGIVLA